MWGITALTSSSGVIQWPPRHGGTRSTHARLTYTAAATLSQTVTVTTETVKVTQSQQTTTK